ncbi:hypothetical protein [Actinomadura rubrisoli]|uniref:Uncharacterized protein n=1 Tax=Actinomadura rubrisoli TaxID=2530368 RepID=A0A4R5AHP3_9ACTN|nr:hypothetical protein [Actinomadura rubrisoli]TDD70839.1 hypothetical protein E1298_36385 [Actinomadura rubrisoli]
MKTKKIVTLSVALGLMLGGLTATTAVGSAAAEPKPAAPAPATPGPQHKDARTFELKNARKLGPGPTEGYTFCARDVSDGTYFRITGSSIIAGQPAVASATEANPDDNFREFMGDSHVYSENVSVLSGEIRSRIHTGWGAPIGACLHLIL